MSVLDHVISLHPVTERAINKLDGCKLELLTTCGRQSVNVCIFTAFIRTDRKNNL